MNEKAYVSKELNSKHRKILEGLLKLPENKECADCKTRAPRWASVNLGIFICMQCSGIHRSLGVHISKVRSATLDTWLPEQVAFIQTMGNDKSNSYWEAELPPRYDRVGIQNFIRAKYQEKRWVPRDGKAKSPSTVNEGKASVPRPVSRSGHQYTNNVNHISEERKIAHLTVIVNKISSPQEHNTPATAKVVQQVKPDPKPQEPSLELAVTKTEPKKLEASSSPVATQPKPTTPVAAQPKVTALVAVQPKVTTPVSAQSTTITTPAAGQHKVNSLVVAQPKVDYATELFNLLSVDNTTGNDSKMSTDENTWVSFQSSEDLDCESCQFEASKEKSTAEISTLSKSSESKVQTKYGIEDLFSSPPSVVAQSFPQQTPKDAKNGIINVFEKPKMVSPFSVNYQQQPSHMANSAKAFAGPQPLPVNVHQPSLNGIQLPNHGRSIVSHQVAGQPKHVQARNGHYMYPAGNLGNHSTTSMYAQGLAINGTTNVKTSRPPSVNPTQIGIRDYDFSSLTQGMFTTKR